MRKGISERTKIGVIFSTPYFVFAIVFFLIPLVWAVWLSTMDWNLMAIEKTWVGLGNYLSAFTSERVQAAFLNTFKYMAVLIPGVTIFATGIAVLLHNLPQSIKGVYSVSFFIPYLTSGVAVSVVVRYFFSYSSVFNTFLRDQLNVDVRWFQDPTPAFFIITGIIIWKISGYYALIILAALESIPKEIHDAAAVDGATGVQGFFRITLPMIVSSYSTVIVLLAGLIFGIFSEPFLLTGGGPNLATTSWYLELYTTSFVKFDSGMGAAIAILNAIQIFITIRLITYVLNKIDYNAR
ncbi:carbohydrate ABC transporter permease [Spirochaeta lutea]|uniref:Sugar ABC transporter permease n=1 Tax=Spirochaeta lutea TaxID=1480694 RepID=A0A098QWJ2_9SPIO|nr:sugar ABC transporter permease [Spirochaeta lutea]KGE70812.1 sugar ABC transporter permease [Spirochaeta lutea]